MDYSSKKYQRRILIDKELEWSTKRKIYQLELLIYENSVRTTHRQRIREEYSSTKNKLGILIDEESEWNTQQQSFRVDYSSTNNHIGLLIDKESVRTIHRQIVS